MKKLLILFCLIWAYSEAQAQSDLASLIAEYEKHCAQKVPDTITQYGTITYKMVPVKDGAGKIVHYAMGEPDTTWLKPDCGKYKSHRVRDSIFSGWIDDNYGITLTSSEIGGPILKTTQSDGYKEQATRKYVCYVELREVEPWSDDFWSWVKASKK